MKKVLLYTTGLLLMIGTRALAQSDVTTQTSRVQYGTLYLGPVGGFGNSWVSNLPGNIMYKSSGYVGVGLIKMESQHWGWGGQLTLSSEGYAINDYGSIQTIKPLYFRVPLRAYYFFGH